MDEIPLFLGGTLVLLAAGLGAGWYAGWFGIVVPVAITVALGYGWDWDPDAIVLIVTVALVTTAGLVTGVVLRRRAVPRYDWRMKP